VNSRLTFIDSGVLISAFRGTSAMGISATVIIDDPNRRFASSPFVQLETLPKATYHNQNDEQEFYNTFFADVSDWANDLNRIVEIARKIGSNYGIAAIRVY
jgi:hypothetical protein